jgi:hypothetical protein
MNVVDYVKEADKETLLRHGRVIPNRDLVTSIQTLTSRRPQSGGSPFDLNLPHCNGYHIPI